MKSTMLSSFLPKVLLGLSLCPMGAIPSIEASNEKHLPRSSSEGHFSGHARTACEGLPLLAFRDYPIDAFKPFNPNHEDVMFIYNLSTDQDFISGMDYLLQKFQEGGHLAQKLKAEERLVYQTLIRLAHNPLQDPQKFEDTNALIVIKGILAHYPNKTTREVLNQAVSILGDWDRYGYSEKSEPKEEEEEFDDSAYRIGIPGYTVDFSKPMNPNYFDVACIRALKTSPSFLVEMNTVLRRFQGDAQLANRMEGIKTVMSQILANMDNSKPENFENSKAVIVMQGIFAHHPDIKPYQALKRAISILGKWDRPTKAHHGVRLIVPSLNAQS